MKINTEVLRPMSLLLKSTCGGRSGQTRSCRVYWISHDENKKYIYRDASILKELLKPGDTFICSTAIQAAERKSEFK